MSSWILLVRAIHAAGGEAPRRQLDYAVESAELTVTNALQEARRRGLVESDHRGCKSSIWRLTELGRAFCEGRAEARKYMGTGTRGGRPRIVIAATWLSSLPQGIRIEEVQPDRAA